MTDEQHELKNLRAVVKSYESGDVWQSGYLARMGEIVKLRNEISQKQKRENKATREVEYYKRKATRLGIDNENLVRMLNVLGLPREQIAELGMRLFLIFNKDAQ